MDKYEKIQILISWIKEIDEDALDSLLQEYITLNEEKDGE
jgi:hypothetical protein